MNYKFDEISVKEKIKLVKSFIELRPFLQIQDFYKWLYSGEFGETESWKGREILNHLLDEVHSEIEINSIDKSIFWEPLGFADRFVKIYTSSFYLREYPMMRIVNLINRSSAFQGNRIHFKNDWIFLKNYILKNTDYEFTKIDFSFFEDSIDINKLPEIKYSSEFNEHEQRKFRVVSKKLLFYYFPELLGFEN